MNHNPSDLDALRRDPQAAALLNDTAALKRLLSAPETQQLMNLLQQKGGASLKSAAHAAAQGQPDALMGLLNQVTSSREGAQAVEKLKEKTGG